jgi:hypothetical protein
MIARAGALMSDEALGQVMRADCHAQTVFQRSPSSSQSLPLPH